MPAQQPSANSSSVLLAMVSPAQQPVKTVAAAKMIFALLSLHTVMTVVVI